MPYKIGNKTIPLDTAFEHDGIQYPSNWIRLATESEKSAIGLVWESEEDMSFDPRFYWSKDLPKALEDKAETKEDGTPLMVQKYNPVTEAMEDTDKQVVTKGLKSQFIQQIKQTAGSILSQTDWYITRKTDIGTEVPANILAYRAEIRAKADELEIAITNCLTVESLASLDMSFPAME